MKQDSDWFVVQGSAVSDRVAVAPRGAERHFLFLQSHPSRFAAEVAGALEREGHRTSRIDFSVADWIFWFPRKSVAYRGRLSGWQGFLENYVDRHGVTDIVYYADCRPYHAIARKVARPRGIRAFAYEYGYLRPDWITLEPDGMGVLSHFPADPARIRTLAARLPRVIPELRHGHVFAHEAFNEIVFDVSPILFAPAFPFYEPDWYYHPFVDFPSHLVRILGEGRAARRGRADLAAIRESGAPCFLVGMQLQADYQIRNNSAYRHVSWMIEEVLVSFADRAPRDARLMFRPHPLDNNLERWQETVRRRAAELGIAERVSIVAATRLSETLARCTGAVVVNSTLGLQALRNGLKVKALGPAIYDMPGLTFQGSLDAFWTTEERPDPTLYADLVSVMAATIQIQGNFFSRDGRDAAVPVFVRRLVDDTARRLGAYEPTPPRLAAARAAGVVTSDDVAFV